MPHYDVCSVRDVIKIHQNVKSASVQFFLGGLTDMWDIIYI